MVQRDYILRIIEQLGAMLIELRKAILGGGADSGTVEATLRQAASQAGMELDLARAAAPESLHAMIAPAGEVEPTRCWVLAEMFLTDGAHQLAQGRTVEAERAFTKARTLFALVGTDALIAGYPEANDRIREIDALLDGLGEGPVA